MGTKHTDLSATGTKHTDLMGRHFKQDDVDMNDAPHQIGMFIFRHTTSIEKKVFKTRPESKLPYCAVGPPGLFVP